MRTYEWGALLPEQVAEWINFDRENPAWMYEGESSTTMPSRQAEGVAYLWNLLSLKGVALLADEVGMGKTFQALGVAALLWKMKPDARVLVMAPNRDICAHWRREYESFVRFHYRFADHCVKNGADGGPVQAVQNCWRLDDLAAAVESHSAHLYLTTIHSLSGLVDKDNKCGDILAKAKSNASRIHKRIKHALGDKGFDLIIVDEAHYFRNRDGGSQRVNAAQAFFGDPDSPLAEKVLMMTATPSHSHLGDVKTILGYFKDMTEEADSSVIELMKKYGLRRFRRMRGKETDFCKREYRLEKESPSDFSSRPESEMFFALYQKKLVTELGFTRNNKSLLYGFLEGFESTGRNPVTNSKSNEEAELPEEQSAAKDFSKASDTDLLRRLTGQFYESFKRIPDHPKYGQIVDECMPDDLFACPRALHEDKHLIFVRRIPSVRELTQRVNEAYDLVLARKIYGAWGLGDDHPAVLNWKERGWSRNGFDDLLQNLKVNLEQQDDEDILVEEVPANDPHEETRLGSLIADLFVVKKGKNARTDCANVSLRFRKPESAFAMFLEPASDYLMGDYNYYYQSRIGEKLRSDYVTAARVERFSLHGLETQKIEAAYRGENKRFYIEPFKTVWAIVFPYLTDDQREKLHHWSCNRPDVAENFASYIKAGFLFASPVMVELYAWFTEFSRLTNLVDVEKKYKGFVNFVSERIESSMLLAYFRSALDTFEILCEKITDHKLGDWEKGWRVLTSLQNPAWYASGESGDRQRLILGFNSPFYPNVLVATSVFKEGVNLHVQCRKVHHYGIAGSPGDNEQRVGRVDRLFGKVNQLLKVDGMTELEIHYPFLKNSIDEDQVASFIARKFYVEEKMDACTQSSFDNRVELTRENWKEFLRKPVKKLDVKDPYPARFHQDLLPRSVYKAFKNHHDSDIARYIISLFETILDPHREKQFSVGNNMHYPNAILLIDPVVEQESKIRRQPVIVEKHFSPDFSALVNGTVYYLSLKSPIATYSDIANVDPSFLKEFFALASKLYATHPLVRLVIEPRSAMSHFYVHARADLPLFVSEGKMEVLSAPELSMVFQQLKRYSDILEYKFYSGNRDLPVEELQMENFLTPAVNANQSFTVFQPRSNRVSRWEKQLCPDGIVEYLSKPILLPTVDKKLFEDIDSLNIDSLLFQVMLFNGKFPFVCFKPDDKNLQANIFYPSEDMQEEESLLLEKWLDYVVNFLKVFDKW